MPSRNFGSGWRFVCASVREGRRLLHLATPLLRKLPALVVCGSSSHADVGANASAVGVWGL